MSVLKMHITNFVNVNVTEMCANCSSRNVSCSVSKVEIISLAFKWLIVCTYHTYCAYQYLVNLVTHCLS